MNPEGNHFQIPASFLESLNEGVLLFDEHLDIQFINARMELFAGLKSTSKSKLSLAAIFKQKAELRAITKQISEHFSKGADWSMAVESPFASGQDGRYNLRLYCENSQSKTVGYLVCSAMEKKQDSFLSKAEITHLFRSYFDHIDNSIFMKDLDGKFLGVNKAFIRATKLNKEDIIGYGSTILFPTEVRQEIERIDKEVLDTGKDVRYEAKRTVNGEERSYYVTKSPLIDAKGRTCGLMGISADITEMRQNDKRIWELGRQLENLIANVPGMVYRCLLDDQWTMLFASMETKKLTGYAPEALINNRDIAYNDLILAEDQALVFREVDKAVGKDIPYQINYRIKTKGGRIKWVWEKGRGVRDKNGNLEFLEGIIVDSTARREYEEQAFMLSRISQNMKEALITTDMKGIVQTWSPGATKMFGYSKKETIGKHILMVYPESFRDKAKDLIYMATLRHGNFTFQPIFQKKNGTRFHGHLSLSVIKDRDGQPFGIAGIIFDVSKEQLLKHKLKASEESYRRVVESMNEGIWQVDKNGITVYVNKALARMIGYPRKSMIGKPAIRFLDKEGIASFRKQFKKRTRGLSSRYEMSYISKAGKQIPVSISASPIKKAGKFDGSIAFITNISRRLKDEQIKKEYRQSLLSLTRASKEGIVFHSNGLILNANEAFCRLLGYRKNEVIGSHITKFANSDFVKKIMDRVKTGKEGVYDARGLTKDGRTLEGQIIARNTKYMGKDARVVVIRDLTDIRQAERKILELNATLEDKVVERTAQLERANKELESFSFSVSHDLRAPLRAIKGFARILELEHASELTDEANQLLGIIVGNTFKMERIIEDLLQFSRIGTQPLHTVDTNINRLFAAALDEHKSSIEANKTSIHISDMPSAHVDPHLIQLVINNLVSNAIKFSAKKRNPKIEIGFKVDQEKPHFYVRDNGAGFNMRYKNKLFKVFQRLHAETDFEGTGIGLAIANRIIKRHKGKIWISGKVNKGAEVKFTLPLSSNEQI